MNNPLVGDIKRKGYFLMIKRNGSSCYLLKTLLSNAA